MAVREIVQWPAKILETPAAPVTVFDKELKTLVTDMHETMDAANGIGLAANQIGLATRVITIHIPWNENKYSEEDEKKESWHGKRFTFINPVISRKEGKISWQEGCLSFPEIYELVDRAAEVWIEAFDENGEQFKVHANGLFSVCIQHEIDHIDGTVFVDRMSRLKAELIRKKMMRRSRIIHEKKS